MTITIYDSDGSVRNVIYHVVDILYDGPRKELFYTRFVKCDGKLERKVLKNIERFVCDL